MVLKDSDGYTLDARRFGNVARFINHRCDANLAPIKVFAGHQDLRFPRICLFAVRDIRALEELGYDYGPNFWMVKCSQFTCTCSARDCRYSRDKLAETTEQLKMAGQLSPSFALPRFPESNSDANAAASCSSRWVIRAIRREPTQSIHVSLFLCKFPAIRNFRGTWWPVTLRLKFGFPHFLLTFAAHW